MNNSPFDPNSPLFPWYRAVSQRPPPLADILKGFQPEHHKPFDLSVLDGLLPKITIRRRVFFSYQHSSDQAYYEAFSKIFHDGYEAIVDNSLERRIDSDDTNYVIQRIRDNYITGSSCTIVLVGPTSYERKYIDWEIKATLESEHGLIGVQLPTLPIQPNKTVIVPNRLHSNITSGYALWLTWAQITANVQTLNSYVEDACSRSKKLLINPKEIKKQNG